MKSSHNPVPLEKKTMRALLLETMAGVAWGILVAIFVLYRFWGSRNWFMLGVLTLCEIVVLRQVWIVVREIQRRRRMSHEPPTV